MNKNPHNHLNKKGAYDGVEYVIYFHTISDRNETGGLAFYTAYIKIPNDHYWTNAINKKKWFDLGLTHWKMMQSEAKRKKLPFNEPKPKSRRHYSNRYDDIELNVHGGVTFARKIKKEDLKKWKQDFTPGYWVGWDYGHAGDYNHDKEWHENLMQSDDPSDVRLGTELAAIETKFDLKYPTMPRLMREKDHSLEEVEADCIDAIQQLRSTYGAK